MIDNEAKESTYLNELDDKFVKRAVEVVYSHIDNSEFNKDTFASEMNVNPRTIDSYLKEIGIKDKTNFNGG